VLYLLVLVFPWPPSPHLSRSYWLPPSWTTNRRLRWQTWCYLDLHKPGLSNLLWKCNQRRYPRHIRVALCFFGGDGWLDGGTWRGWRVRRGAREFSSRCTRKAASRSSSYPIPMKIFGFHVRRRKTIGLKRRGFPRAWVNNKNDVCTTP
jgi:hypothetical protein